jgi:hypothetical protein
MRWMAQRDQASCWQPTGASRFIFDEDNDDPPDLIIEFRTCKRANARSGGPDLLSPLSAGQRPHQVSLQRPPLHAAE